MSDRGADLWLLREAVSAAFIVLEPLAPNGIVTVSNTVGRAWAPSGSAGLRRRRAPFCARAHARRVAPAGTRAPTRIPARQSGARAATVTSVSTQENGLKRAAEVAAEGRLDELRRILGTTPDVLEARDPDGRSLLGLACRAATGNVALPPNRGTLEQHAAIDVILAAGADPDASDHDGWKPLHTAAVTGHIDLARRLLAAGASREGTLLGARGGSPLALALLYAQSEMGEWLADPPVPDNLRTAAALGRDLERFLDEDALTPQAAEGLDFYRPLRVFPVWERTLSRQEILDEALCWAARHDRCNSMRRLVELGANVNANPYRGTALTWSVYGDKVAAARWLLDEGADPDLRHDFGGEGHGVGAVAMHLAAQFGAVGCLRLLLDRGADPNLRDEAFQGTPLDWAEYGGAAEAARMLREAGAEGRR